MKSDWLWERGAVILISVSVLYWKLTRSLSKSYPVVCLRTRFLLVVRNCSFEAFYSFTAHRDTALPVGMFQSFTVLGKKECLYTAISVVAESICLLLDVLDGLWLYSILLSAGMASYVHRMHYVGWMVYGV